ncbi:hypothetical protein M2302_001862 [Micromonospora sp. A200]|uniref:hypothetical protein n=1 Tax=Micromonospora sp. A200 TaxID=2940568 RepID=UPI00247725EF|nr:hypothetical protein [Micromonospora sp. A200]MDH6461687.1 hypothetical protein [Micromonospora sp. A200]
MLPVPLTSPLWWVARWSSRLLTGLALAVALSVGGPAVPDAGPLSAAPSQAGAPVLADLAVPDGSAVRAAAVPAVTLAVGNDQSEGRAFVAPPAPVTSIDPVGRPAHAVTAPLLPLTGQAAGTTGPRAPPVG